MATPAPHLSHPKYRPDIDGLRAVAVLSVVTFHAFPALMKGGFIGVDVFFVISGFLISTIIFQGLDGGNFSFSEFYARRIRRIFPALVLVLLASLAFGWLVLIPEELNQLGKHIAAGVGFVSNFVLWRESGYFDNSAETKPLLHLWSLGIEEQFYIVWPLVLWLAWKRKFNLLTLTAVVALISFGLNAKGIEKDSVATFYSPQTRFWELMSGSVLAWFTLYKKSAHEAYITGIDARLTRILYREGVEADGKALSNVLSCFGCLLLLYGFFEISKGLNFPGKWAAIPVLGAVLVILAGPKAWLNRNVLSSKPLVWFGLISFPLYLWHWPLLSFVRIIRNETPRPGARIAAVLASVLLAWLTVKFLERPIRLGHHKVKLKLAALCGSMVAVGIVGVLVSSHDHTATHGFEKLAIKRKGFEHAFGSSTSWYRGKDDWLFLGNANDNTVAKLKLAIKPDAARLNAAQHVFSQISASVAGYGTRVVLFVAPNKSTVYPEYLPDELTPSSTRYVSYFVNALKDVPGLTVYDATNDLLASKRLQGILYWKTDTHWNRKGAFVAYAGFSGRLGLPVPGVDFKRGQVHSGDLIGISKLKNFPLNADDDWSLVWKENPVWREEDIPNEQKTTFGSAVVVTNSRPLSNKHVWVLGDSFARSLRPYFNATFKEVRYVGHWEQKLDGLAADLSKTEGKPDLIVVVVAERLM
jgi:peptidoglycan/LPS O-acetylase OafA/YrhL